MTDPIDQLNSAEKAHLLSILILESGWMGSKNRMAFLDLLRKCLDEKAKRRKKRAAGWVWQMPDGSYIKKPNSGWYSLSNEQQFEGKENEDGVVQETAD